MAVLNKKEDKVQAVLDRLPKEYTHEQFVGMFIKLFSKDWGKIKSAYIKQSQDKEPGTVINMPNPKNYLQQVLDTYLNKVKTESNSSAPVIEEEAVSVKAIKKDAKTKDVEETDEAPLKSAKETVKKTKAAPKKKEL